MSWLILANGADGADPYWESRHQMVETCIATAGVIDPRVLHAIRNTLRHEFMPEEMWKQAYLDMAVPIGDSQTISSPFTVALMTETLRPSETDRVLEIGTGSGYQAAVLSPLVEHVYSVEIMPCLSRQASQTLRRLKYENVSTRVADGFEGWPEASPFDKIIVTCSPESVPQPLVEQLREGGTLIIPVGERYQQTLFRMVKINGKLVQEELRPTLFVPMTGEAEDGRQVLPDATNPGVVNGDFEMKVQHPHAPASSLIPLPTANQVADQIPGWYYGRQVSLMDSNSRNPAAVGNTFVRFTNQTPGLNSHLLQGISVDGRHVQRMALSGSCRSSSVVLGADANAAPMISISLYNDSRSQLAVFWLGPFGGTHDWKTQKTVFDVPTTSREAILRIGLFGATGTADFDGIQLSKAL
ncbi:protein-L-isoaspartate(D-aspartate) O-methyltransferase [Rubripirellula sp.]|nr:protein-L-isoaspartate(D-aspartate) O-methyltransferase [Rubripirellula sp.]MDB4634586.1 protein-L-isoaspartate(D-aspartate) O-methyltransferase [Rubripirellula sp.]MDC0287995.1 protein-L-isoaspartate(D-aspartate) O-methyltransferase [Rubripirellula sp.]